MTAVAQTYRQVRAFILRPWALWTLFAINVIAGIIGAIYWYGADLLQTPWWALVFVPDCPLFAALFAVALAGIALGRREWTWFNAITTVGLIKYGIWTVTVWILFWRAGYPATTESVVMTLTHIGMILEGVMLASFLTRLRLRHALLAGAWFYLSDWVDYGLGFRPRMAPGVSETFMMWEMIIVTALLTLFLAWLAWRRRGTAAV
jgi:uncharacterized membrane protein YpjA